MSKIISLFTCICLAAAVESHVAHWNTPNQLHPVHGLFVKPSSDGTTGDLYVAATEDTGVKSQWLTDQPVNFLPTAAASQSHQSALPVPFTGYPHEESFNQKRAVVNPPVQYAYALPVPSGSESGAVAPYPYALPTAAMTSSSSESSTSTCTMDPAKANIQQYPFQYFYPQMMSAYANALSILKDAGLSDDTASSVMSQTSPMWPPYGYPMYVMVDPSAWAQSQATPSSSTTSTTNSDNA
ncbi:uncharacterized protein LOC115445172 [Manduca sexta]|uniref:VMP25 n=1 Tax=Manduca sexta TaxID=7130 RepID=I0E0A2_MANSE|nr:uncharacterized protein LOC115445172 [Manduca sexta]AFH96020.1 VMP25 [Manduca sexta]